MGSVSWIGPWGSDTHELDLFQGQNLANTSWAFATLRVGDEDFFDAVAKVGKWQAKHLDPLLPYVAPKLILFLQLDGG